MLTESAFTVVQANVADWPGLMVDGVAAHPNTSTCVGKPITATVAVEVSSFTLLRAVSTYVVVVLGDTDSVPEVATLPMPAIFTVSALRVRQLSVTGCPATICFGSAVKNRI